MIQYMYMMILLKSMAFFKVPTLVALTGGKHGKILFMTVKGGFLGCRHPGTINCLNSAIKLLPGKKIHTLVARMQLDNVSSIRLQITI